jgi:hypothetical protein
VVQSSVSLLFRRNLPMTKLHAYPHHQWTLCSLIEPTMYGFAESVRLRICFCLYSVVISDCALLSLCVIQRRRKGVISDE